VGKLVKGVTPMKIKSQIVYPHLGIVDEIEEEVNDIDDEKSSEDK
jgi:hypothetical protein